jgi:hypothetical protein
VFQFVALTYLKTFHYHQWLCSDEGQEERIWKEALLVWRYSVKMQTIKGRPGNSLGSDLKPETYKQEAGIFTATL